MVRDIETVPVNDHLRFRAAIGADRATSARGRRVAHTDPIDLATYRGADGEGYRGVGDELRAARETAGYGLEHISAALRIRRQHLEAIEKGRFEDLPGRVYALGFVRGYAEFLGLDGDIIVQRYRGEAVRPAPEVELNFPEPPAQQWRPNFLPFALALVIAGSAYGVWNYLQTRDEVPRELMAEIPEELAAELGIDTTTEATSEPVIAPTVAAADGVPGAATESVEPAADETVAVPTEAETATPDAVPLALATRPDRLEPMTDPTASTDAIQQFDLTAPADVVADAPILVNPSNTAADAPAETIAGLDIPQVLVEDGPPPPPPTAPVADYEPRVYGLGNEGARVVVRATADSWVQVQGADNDLLLTRILHPGDKFLVPDRADLVLSTGNAGGLEVFVDGALMPALGGPGDVLRGVSLDPQDLLSGRSVQNR